MRQDVRVYFGGRTGGGPVAGTRGSDKAKAIAKGDWVRGRADGAVRLKSDLRDARGMAGSCEPRLAS